MTPKQWDTAIVQHPVSWRRQHLANEVRAYLESPGHHVECSSRISTHDLIEALYPELSAHGEAIKRRERLFDDMAYLAAHGDLEGYWTNGEPKVVLGHRTVPKLWHKPAKPSKPPAPTRYSAAQGFVHEDVDGAYVRWEDVQEFFS